MTGKKTIYLIRHGETEFNKLGIVQGSGVDSDLNETGKRQAALFFEQYGNIPFDKIYISGLKRTYQSVARFIEELNLPYEKLEGLNEIRWGDYEGQHAHANWRQDYLAMIAEWGNGNLHHRVPNGENPIELQERQKAVFEYIMQQPNEETILICMHGRAMKSFLCLMMGLHLKNMDTFSHQNLGLYVLEYNEGKFEITKENCGNHLQQVSF